MPPTVSDKKPQCAEPRGPPGAGVGLPPIPEAPPAEDMVEAKYEKKLVVPPRREERVKPASKSCLRLQKHYNLVKQERKHLGQIPNTSTIGRSNVQCLRRCSFGWRLCGTMSRRCELLVSETQKPTNPRPRRTTVTP